jgi:hypothetical protein
MTTERERSESIEIMESCTLREDMRHLAEHRYNPTSTGGNVDIEKYTEFVTAFNEFVNHAPKPFKPIPDKNMKL